MKSVFIFLAGSLLLTSCQKSYLENKTKTPTSLTPYKLEVPANFPDPDLPDDNPLTVEGVKLGRMLFYDPIWSGNGRTCSTCHLQTMAFTNDNQAMRLDPVLYPAIANLSNMNWRKVYGWAGEFEKMDVIPEGDFSPLFLDPDLDTIINKLRKHPVYPGLFSQVYGHDVLNKNEIVKSISYALSQFLRTIVTANSKYDRFLRGELPLAAAEQRGQLLFFTEKGDCFHCHGSVLFTDNQFHNIGLDSEFTGKNIGRYGVTGNKSDLGKFRTPSLRNIALTPPYMHDGRFKTLDEAIQHYNKGVKRSPTLDPVMTLPGKEFGLRLSNQDVSDLKAFLNTLTDTSFIHNKAYGNPF